MKIKFSQLITSKPSINVKFSSSVSKNYNVNEARTNGIYIDPDDCSDLNDIKIAGNFKPEIGNFNEAFQALPRTVSVAIEDLEEYLESLAENTPENPYVVNVTGLTQEHFHTESSASNVAGSYLSQIIQNSSKYVTLKEKETSYNNAKIEDFSFAANSYLTGIMGYVSMGYSIGQYAFMGCTSLTSIEIPDSVTSIGFVTFGLCASLISITIPVSVTSIDSGAFVGCSSLTITSNNTKYVTCSNGHGLIDTSTKTLIWSNENIIPNDGSVNSIDSYALSYCPSLTNITIPDSITSIGGWVFEGCTSLTSINISDSVTEIGDYAFNGCSSLTSITIPDSITSISTGAFQNCTALTSITIPSSVTSIGYSAFDSCMALTTINYTGSEEQWNAISKSTAYIPKTATINFNYQA